MRRFNPIGFLIMRPEPGQAAVGRPNRVICRKNPDSSNQF